MHPLLLLVQLPGFAEVDPDADRREQRAHAPGRGDEVVDVRVGEDHASLRSSSAPNTMMRTPARTRPMPFQKPRVANTPKTLDRPGMLEGVGMIGANCAPPEPGV
jgi:hypothetical protein